MNALGAPLTQARNGGALDHGGCVEPAFFQALTLFNSFADILSSTAEPVRLPSLQLSPNPVRSGGWLRWTQAFDQPLQMEIFSLRGQRLHQFSVPADRQSQPLPQLTPGSYLLRGRSGDQLFQDRLIVH